MTITTVPGFLVVGGYLLIVLCIMAWSGPVELLGAKVPNLDRRGNWAVLLAFGIASFLCGMWLYQEQAQPAANPAPQAVVVQPPRGPMILQGPNDPLPEDNRPRPAPKRVPDVPAFPPADSDVPATAPAEPAPPRPGASKPPFLDIPRASDPGRPPVGQLPPGRS
jgi:hypothetical protein